jgi:hypothetical protein
LQKFAILNQIPFEKLKKQIVDQIAIRKRGNVINQRAVDIQLLFVTRLRAISDLSAVLKDAAESTSKFGAAISGTLTVLDQSSVLSRPSNIADQGRFRSAVVSTAGQFGARGQRIGRDAIASQAVISQLPEILLSLRAQDPLGQRGDFISRLDADVSAIIGTGAEADFIKEAIIDRARGLIGAEGKDVTILELIGKDLGKVAKDLSKGFDPIFKVLAETSKVIAGQLNQVVTATNKRRELEFKILSNTQLLINEQESRLQFRNDNSVRLGGRDNRLAISDSADRARQIGNLSGTGMRFSDLNNSRTVGAELVRVKQLETQITLRLNDAKSRGLEADVRLISVRDKLIEKGEKLTKQLEFLAKSGQRASAAQKELGKIRSQRQARFNVASSFTFGSDDTRKQLAKTIQLVTALGVGQGRNINQLGGEDRSAIGSFLSSLEGSDRFSQLGQNARGENRSIDEFRKMLVAQSLGGGADAMTIALMNRTGPEDRLIAKIDKLLIDGEKARNELIKGLASEQKSVVEHIRDSLEAFTNKLEELFLRREVSRLKREGLRGQVKIKKEQEKVNAAIRIDNEFRTDPTQTAGAVRNRAEVAFSQLTNLKEQKDRLASIRAQSGITREAALGFIRPDEAAILDKPGRDEGVRGEEKLKKIGDSTRRLFNRVIKDANERFSASSPEATRTFKEDLSDPEIIRRSSAAARAASIKAKKSFRDDNPDRFRGKTLSSANAQRKELNKIGMKAAERSIAKSIQELFDKSFRSIRADTKDSITRSRSNLGDSGFDAARIKFLTPFLKLMEKDLEASEGINISEAVAGIAQIKKDTDDIVKNYNAVNASLKKILKVQNQGRNPKDTQGVERARGGIIPGSGNRDTVPALLTPGEFVLRKSAAQALGADNLNRLNNVQKFANGGSVGGYDRELQPAVPILAKDVAGEREMRKNERKRVQEKKDFQAETGERTVKRYGNLTEQQRFSTGQDDPYTWKKHEIGPKLEKQRIASKKEERNRLNRRANWRDSATPKPSQVYKEAEWAANRQKWEDLREKREKEHMKWREDRAMSEPSFNLRIKRATKNNVQKFSDGGMVRDNFLAKIDRFVRVAQEAASARESRKLPPAGSTRMRNRRLPYYLEQQPLEPGSVKKHYAENYQLMLNNEKKHREKEQKRRAQAAKKALAEQAQRPYYRKSRTFGMSPWDNSDEMRRQPPPDAEPWADNHIKRPRKRPGPLAKSQQQRLSTLWGQNPFWKSDESKWAADLQKHEDWDVKRNRRLAKAEQKKKIDDAKFAAWKAKRDKGLAKIGQQKTGGAAQFAVNDLVETKNDRTERVNAIAMRTQLRLESSEPIDYSRGSEAYEQLGSAGKAFADFKERKKASGKFDNTGQRIQSRTLQQQLNEAKSRRVYRSRYGRPKKLAFVLKAGVKRNSVGGAKVSGGRTIGVKEMNRIRRDIISQGGFKSIRTENFPDVRDGVERSVQDSIAFEKSGLFQQVRVPYSIRRRRNDINIMNQPGGSFSDLFDKESEEEGGRYFYIDKNGNKKLIDPYVKRPNFRQTFTPPTGTDAKPNRKYDFRRGLFGGTHPLNTVEYAEGDPRRMVGHGDAVRRARTTGRLKRRRGRFDRLNSGGPVSGLGNSDTVRALLTPGEFVINKASADNIGLQNLHSLNQSPQKLQHGGQAQPNGSGTVNLEGIMRLQETVTAFSSVADKLSDALNNFPREIQHTINGKVEVIINGASVLAEMMPAIRDMITAKAGEAINDFTKKNFPELGQQEE